MTDSTTPAHRARNVLDPMTMAMLDRRTLRRRRRTGQDTHRGQRRAVLAGRRYFKTPAGQEAYKEAMVDQALISLDKVRETAADLRDRTAESLANLRRRVRR